MPGKKDRTRRRAFYSSFQLRVVFLDVFPFVSGVQKATVSTSYCPQEGAEGRDLNVQIWWFFDFLLFNLFIALLSIRFKMFSNLFNLNISGEDEKKAQDSLLTSNQKKKFWSFTSCNFTLHRLKISFKGASSLHSNPSEG